MPGAPQFSKVNDCVAQARARAVHNALSLAACCGQHEHQRHNPGNALRAVSTSFHPCVAHCDGGISARSAGGACSVSRQLTKQPCGSSIQTTSLEFSHHPTLRRQRWHVCREGEGRVRRVRVCTRAMLAPLHRSTSPIIIYPPMAPLGACVASRRRPKCWRRSPKRAPGRAARRHPQR